MNYQIQTDVPRHEMSAHYEGGETTFTCEECSRRVKINADGQLEIIEKGDEWALHHGQALPLSGSTEN